MKSTRLVSYLGAATMLLAAPIAWGQASPGAGVSPATPNQSESGSGMTERHGTTASTTDMQLENRVKQALQQDPKLNAADISVNAKNNVVYLTGSVDNRTDRSHAVEVASRVDGVQKVEDKINVSGSR